MIIINYFYKGRVLGSSNTVEEMPKVGDITYHKKRIYKIEDLRGVPYQECENPSCEVDVICYLEDVASER